MFLHKSATGEWNFDTLSEWDTPDLLEWGFDEKELGMINFSVPEPKPQKEPEIKSEVLIQIYCAKSDLSEFEKVLNDWGSRRGVTIDIS